MGRRFPAAVYAGRGIAPIVLADGDNLPPPTAAHLQDGGTPLGLRHHRQHHRVRDGSRGAGRGPVTE